MCFTILQKTHTQQQSCLTRTDVFVYNRQQQCYSKASRCIVCLPYADKSPESPLSVCWPVNPSLNKSNWTTHCLVISCLVYVWSFGKQCTGTKQEHISLVVWGDLNEENVPTLPSLNIKTSMQSFSKDMLLVIII